MSLSEILAKAGVLSKDTLSELRHWKVPGPEVEAALDASVERAPDDVLVLQKELDAAFQDKDFVLVRVTDPTLIQQYLATQTRGVLHVQMGTEVGEYPLVFGKTPTGDYIFPWSSEALEEAFHKGDVWLSEESGERYFFSVNVFYYGEHKAFIVCSTTKNN